MSDQLLPPTSVAVAAPLPAAPPAREPVQITLQRAPSGYTGLILGQPVHLAITDADLTLRNAGFASVLDKVREQTGQKGISLTEADLVGALTAEGGLRYQGRLAFETLFPPGSNARIEIDSILAWGVPLAVSVLSDGFPFFWEMLYSGSMDEGLGLDTLLEGFWGCRHVIARRVIGTGWQSLPQVMRAPSSMLLLVNKGLSEVMGAEVPGLQGHATKYNLQCRLLDDVLSDAAGTKPSTQSVIKYLSQSAFPDDLVHFACHFMPNQSNVDNSRLEITVNSHKVRVQLADLQVYGLHLARRPLVFLNGCWSNARVLLQSKSFVEEFMRRGARGLVATECTMPDVFAAAFASKFYEHFLAGVPVGEALWMTRDHFLRQCHNLLGMAYALYADSQTRIVWPG